MALAKIMKYFYISLLTISLSLSGLEAAAKWTCSQYEKSSVEKYTCQKSTDISKSSVIGFIRIVGDHRSASLSIDELVSIVELKDQTILNFRSVARDEFKPNSTVKIVVPRSVMEKGELLTMINSIITKKSK